MGAILLMVVFMGNQGIHQVITIPVQNYDYCESNKQLFVDAAEYANYTIIKKANCLRTHK